jgi:hypothetical protein
MKHSGIQKIIDVLKNVDNSPESEMGFDMCHWYGDRKESRHPCGSACCIAGWAHASLGGYPNQSTTDAFIEFCDLQNVSMNVINWLTTPKFDLTTLTLPMAIKVLEIFRDTGEVAWRKVYQELV